jgi:LPXTG-motif cell wall-anchored protein
MAIDMIENNEMGALAHSRLGSRNFVDDRKSKVRFRSYTGIQEFEEENFLGILEGKAKQKVRNAVRDKWKTLPKNNCATIQQSIDIVQNDIARITKQLAIKSNADRKTELDETNNVLGDLKSAQIRLNCENIEAQAQQQQAKAETEATLKQAAEEQVQAAKKDIATQSTTTNPSTQNWLIYGGVGLVVVIAAFMILKKKK